MSNFEFEYLYLEDDWQPRKPSTEKILSNEVDQNLSEVIVIDIFGDEED